MAFVGRNFLGEVWVKYGSSIFEPIPTRLDDHIGMAAGDEVGARGFSTKRGRKPQANFSSGASTFSQQRPNFFRSLRKRVADGKHGFECAPRKGPCLLQVKVLSGKLCRYIPVATETARRATESLKLSEHGPTMGGSASRRAAMRVKPEQASKGTL